MLYRYFITVSEKHPRIHSFIHWPPLSRVQGCPGVLEIILVVNKGGGRNITWRGHQYISRRTQLIHTAVSKDNLESPISVMFMSLDLGRKMEYPGGKTTLTQRQHVNSILSCMFLYIRKPQDLSFQMSCSCACFHSSIEERWQKWYVWKCPFSI